MRVITPQDARKLVEMNQNRDFFRYVKYINKQIKSYANDGKFEVDIYCHLMLIDVMGWSTPRDKNLEKNVVQYYVELEFKVSYDEEKISISWH